MSANEVRDIKICIEITGSKSDAYLRINESDLGSAMDKISDFVNDCYEVFE